MVKTGRIFGVTIERFKKYFKKISKMPLNGRVGELKKLRETRKRLERELNDADTKIMLLETMPDIAEYRVERNKVAMGLLQDFREMGEISSRELGNRLKIRDSYIPLIFRYLNLLRTAGLIEMQPDPSYFGDEIIKLTERGKTLQYTEQK